MMKPSVAGSSQLSPPHLSLSLFSFPPSLLTLQLITLIRSPVGPPPARVSLTDGLLNWQWGRGAQPWSGETSLTKDSASQVCEDFCLAWYGKPVSQCHSQISTLLYYAQVFFFFFFSCQGHKVDQGRVFSEAGVQQACNWQETDRKPSLSSSQAVTFYLKFSLQDYIQTVMTCSNSKFTVYMQAKLVISLT